MSVSRLHSTDWRSVPSRVVDLLPPALAVRFAHEQAAEKIGALATSAITWAPETHTVTLHTNAPITKEAYDIYSAAMRSASVPGYAPPAVAEFNSASGSSTYNNFQEILVKCGAMSDWLPNTWNTANKLFGGPTPLSNGIVTGLMAGGLGYGAGALAENLFPERYVERGKLRRTLGIAGALSGVGLGLSNAYVNGRARHTNMLSGLITSNNAEPIPYDIAVKKSAFGNSGFGNERPEMQQPFYAPSINVPQFNNAVWSDVGRGTAHGFQTHTPPQYAAAVTGMMSGLSAQQQSPMISPMTVIRGIASAGVGLATANIAGRALAALGGLTPEGQNKLQDMGLWGGMMHAIVPTMFGR